MKEMRHKRAAAAPISTHRCRAHALGQLASARDVAPGIEVAIEALEQCLDQVDLGQRLAEQPHRGRIGHGILQAQEAHERQPVADLVLDLFIGQVVKRRVRKPQARLSVGSFRAGRPVCGMGPSRRLAGGASRGRIAP
jgi:hypothetical protein